MASALSFCRKKKLQTLNLVIPAGANSLQKMAMLDGLLTANYSYDKLKKESLKEHPTVLVKKVFLIGAKKEDEKLMERALSIVEGVNLARDLVNGNADEVKAHYLTEVAQKMAKTHSCLTCKILRKKDLEREKMGLLLAVGQGASHEPALVLMSYLGDPKSQDVTAVIGKGISFDTGGLNLKPTGSMETMKTDMAGAAAVLGLMQTLASLKVKKNVLGVLACAENAISALSYKPGDVFVSHAGKSVEITNTDAEGRLVLADAFSYVQKEYAPSRIIDLATLTGGVIIALGEEASGLFSNKEDLTKKIQKASEACGERVWPLPLYPEYLEPLKSSIADLKNSGGGRKASAAMGATFLKQFIHQGMPWAHLDIAGTAYLSETSAYHPSLATGVGVRLLLAFLDAL